MKDPEKRPAWEPLRFLEPRAIARFTNEQRLGYETPEDVEAGLKRGTEKAELLRWVRKEMRRRLTKRERRCVELYYFQGLTFRQAAERTGTTASSVHRAVRRSLRKLKRGARLWDDAPSHEP